MNRLEINTLIDKLIGIKDRYRSELSRGEVDAINDACNTLSHGVSREELQEKVQKCIKDLHEYSCNQSELEEETIVEIIKEIME